MIDMARLAAIRLLPDREPLGCAGKHDRGPKTFLKAYLYLDYLQKPRENIPKDTFEKLVDSMPCIHARTVREVTMEKVGHTSY